MSLYQPQEKWRQLKNINCVPYDTDNNSEYVK